jgi:3-hydroxybutyryl-CoA dehydratase
MTNPAQLFAEDLTVGFRFKGEPQLLTSDMFSLFSRMTGDHHPIHEDASYAANTRFGRPVAHGLMLAALTALGATKLSEQLRDSMIAMIEGSFQFRNPAFVGDTLIAEFECKSVNATRTAGTKKVELHVRLINQTGVLVAEGSHKYLLKSRTA